MDEEPLYATAYETEGNLGQQALDSLDAPDRQVMLLALGDRQVMLLILGDRQVMLFILGDRQRPEGSDRRGVQLSWFRVWGVGFGVWGLGFGVQGLGFWV